MHQNMVLFLSKRKASSLDSIKMFQHAYYTTVISILQLKYLGLAWSYHEYVKIARITAHCKPTSLTAKSNRINSRKLISSTDLLDHISCFSLKDSNLVAFL